MLLILFSKYKKTNIIRIKIKIHNNKNKNKNKVKFKFNKFNDSV